MAYVPRANSLPLGVAILAILIGIVGFLFLVVGILVVLAIGFGTVHSAALFGAGFLGGVFLIIFAVVLLVVLVYLIAVHRHFW